MMNILILANHFNAGGISSYILNLARGLVARGHRVYAASRGGEWLKRLAGYGIEHIYVPLHTKSIVSPRLLPAYFILRKVIREKDIGIMHSQTRVSSVLAYWVSRKTSVPFVSTAHGFFRPRWERRVFPCWGERVIAISDAVKEHLVKDFKVSENRIRLVYNGIDLVRNQKSVTSLPRQSEIVRGNQKEIKEKFGLKEGQVVGIIARLSEVKGHRYLITAMKKVIEEIPNAQLLSVGDGKIKEGLEDLARSLHIENRIHFISAVSDTALALSVMDVFVMPSLQEGLGLAIMEAMRAGIPVIGSSVGGIASLVRDGQTGILAAPADSEGLAMAIINILKDRKKARALCDNAAKMIVKEFSLERMALDTEKVYQECLSL